MRYTVQVNMNGLHPGEVVNIDDGELDAWAGEIEAGFLVPTDPVVPVDVEPEDDPDPEGESAEAPVE